MVERGRKWRERGEEDTGGGTEVEGEEVKAELG